MLQLLLVDDSKETTDALAYQLKKEGYALDVCVDAEMAQRRIDDIKYDLAIMETAFPWNKKDGVAESVLNDAGYMVCRQLKNVQPDVPVIFLSDRDSENEVVRAFDHGADDYIVKPYRKRELMSRISCVLRRYNKSTKEIVHGDFRLNLVENRLYRKTDAGEAEINLTALELRIIEYFFQNRGITLTHEKILDRIWDYTGTDVNDNTLRVCIRRIRKKLGNDIIQTVHGIGYRLGA